MRRRRVAVTSIVRGARISEPTGFMRVVDLEEERVLLQAPVRESSYRAIDPNPRGGYRGAKGLSVHGDRLVLANSERLFVFDVDWRIASEITSRWMGSIHDILAEDDGIWVTCTNCDVLLKVGWDGEVRELWSWRLDRKLARELGFRAPPRLRDDRDYRDPRSTYGLVKSTVQLNALTRTDEGLLLSFGRVLSPRAVRRKRMAAWAGRLAAPLGIRWPSEAAAAHGPLPAPPERGSTYALILLRDGRGRPLSERGSAEVLFRRENIAVPNHNVLASGAHVVYNDTDSGRIAVLNREAGVVERAVEVPGSPSFARGLAQLSASMFLVGSQAPAAVHAIDLEAGEVVRSIPLSEEPRESVYAVCVLPDSFAEPPADLVV